MATIDRTALVPFSAEKMYLLVNDIKSYQEFLPWCSASEILEQSEQEMLASVTISGGGLSKAFVTRNTLVPFESITMVHVDGPFKSLTGVWSFNALSEEGCRIELKMDFELTQGLKSMVFGVMFNKIADKLVESFTQRAREVYGKK